MKRIASLFVLLVLTCPLFGQSVTLPPEKKAQRGQWLIVAPSVVDPVDGILEWEIDPGLTEQNLADLLGPELAAKLRGKVISGNTPGKFWVKAWTAKVVGGKAVPSKISTCWITIEGEVPPGPKPPVPPDPVPPVPPEPTDQFWLDLKAAWQKEAHPDRMTRKADLAAYYKTAATAVTTEPLATLGDLRKGMDAAAKRMFLPPPVIPTTDGVIGNWVWNELPKDPAAPMNAELKAKAAATFTKAADYLGRLK